jgi:membrane-associated phospholipid phosphatase
MVLEGFSITGSIASIKSGWLTTIGLLIDNDILFSALIIITGIYLIREMDKRVRFGVALAFAYVIALILKNVLAVPRPCFDDPAVICPASFSLPSMHATMAFTLAFSLLDRKAFVPVLLFALFVCFTRINLGVHTFEDVAAALPIGFISMLAAKEAYKRYSQWKKK